MYTGAAFGIATLIVGVCASVTAWGVKTVLDVKDTPQFAHRMHHEMLTRLPGLYYRIHRRPPEGDDGPDEDGESHWSAPDPDNAYLDWNISEAQERMEKALAEGGPHAWAEVTMRELEHEERKAKEERGGGWMGR